MTDLTEKWKKGKLESGFYYVYLKYLEIFDITTSSTLFGILERGNENCLEIIAPVPSYEEWQAKDKENQQLKGYNEYLRNIIIECEPYIENVCTALNMEKFANGSFLHKSNEVLSKIRTVVGEKK